MKIRAVKETDGKALADLYNHYVLHSQATFEETVLSEKDMTGRIREISSCYPWLVAEEGENIIGYTYATTWKSRSAYRYSAECAIYVDHRSKGRGIGTALMRALIEALRSTDIHCLIAGITLPNPESISLHEKFGFQKAGEFREIGYKFHKWIDVGYWQLTFSGGTKPS